MGVERGIHFAMFALLLVGLCSVTAWASVTYLWTNVVLGVAGIALSWGVILLVLYVGFKQLGWNWWS